MLNNLKWFRKLRKETWYKHQNTYKLPGLVFSCFWARYGGINRYTTVIKTENYKCQ